MLDVQSSCLNVRTDVRRTKLMFKCKD